jgi:thiamine biosynthesis protein ThiS
MMRWMKLTINGAPREVAADTLAALVAELKLEGRPFAVELNRQVVPKAQFQRAALRDGDRVEIVEFVGGG